MKKVICIGSATKDIFVTLDDVRVIDNHQDPTARQLIAFEYGAKVYADRFEQTVGGSAVNTAVGLTRAGYRAFVFSRVSKGEIGTWILKQLAKHKVKKNYMQSSGGPESEVAIILLDKRTVEHVILRTGDSVVSFHAGKALAKFREKVDWLYVGSQKKDWQQHMGQIVAFAQKKKAKIALNPSSYQISKDTKKLAASLKDVEVLLLNRDEAIEIIQKTKGAVTDDPRLLSKQLLSYGAKVVIITDAERGAYVGRYDGLWFLPAAAVKKVDALGAGDAFASGFLANYIETNDCKQAIAWGMANSAAVLGAIGGTKGLLKRKDLKQRAESLVGKIIQM